MRRIFASLLALLGVAAPSQAQQTLANTDLASILYTTPTLSNDIAALEQSSGTVGLTFHEDEWSQVEFLPKEQLHEVQRMLKEYKPFEHANRAKWGWRKV